MLSSRTVTVIVVAPIRTRVPLRMKPRTTSCSPTNVPFVLERSRSSRPRSHARTAQWWRDTDGSVSRSPVPCAVPIVTSSSSETTRSPRSAPSTTATSKRRTKIARSRAMNVSTGCISRMVTAQKPQQFVPVPIEHADGPLVVQVLTSWSFSSHRHVEGPPFVLVHEISFFVLLIATTATHFD